VEVSGPIKLVNPRRIFIKVPVPNRDNCLSFFDLRILITPLVSSSSSYMDKAQLIETKAHVSLTVQEKFEDIKWVI
jgi:hypothetical protein